MHCVCTRNKVQKFYQTGRGNGRQNKNVYFSYTQTHTQSQLSNSHKRTLLRLLYTLFFRWCLISLGLDRLSCEDIFDILESI